GKPGGIIFVHDGSGIVAGLGLRLKKSLRWSLEILGVRIIVGIISLGLGIFWLGAVLSAIHSIHIIISKSKPFLTEKARHSIPFYHRFCLNLNFCHFSKFLY